MQQKHLQLRLQHPSMIWIPCLMNVSERLGSRRNGLHFKNIQPTHVLWVSLSFAFMKVRSWKVQIQCILIQEAPSVWRVELDLINGRSAQETTNQGAVTWISRGIKLQESQIGLSRDMRKFEHHATEIQRLTAACWAN